MRAQKTSFIKPQDANQKWYIIDATDKVVGRLATEIADILRGKTKAEFTPHIDSGDFVIITNCTKVKLTGTKWDDKDYFWHSNHIGGIKKRTAKEQLEKHPEKIILDAVKGMLPKTSLGRKQLTKLKVYEDDQHPHEAQKPTVYQTKN
ncbi:MAG: 50S ribosomal protein L13 [Bacteriovoracaceae bacterium]|nr:50S ribosomal protein L13 [Bacteriovoracaceae bacterium]